MKKLLSLIAIVLFAINTQAQVQVKELKALEATMNTISEMDKMLGKEYTMMTSAVDAVSGADFVMGDCMVLGAYADEAFKKNCQALEDEFGKAFGGSAWSFEKYSQATESIVKVKTKAGQNEQSPYTGFPGSATIKIGMLIDGLTIEAYFYQNKADKTKYLMMFMVGQMGVFAELTKQGGKNNATIVTPAKPKKEELKNKTKK